MSAESITTFYDADVDTSFGYAIDRKAKQISTHWSCANAFNCTGAEIVSN
jgi:hypothetical protein